MIWGGTPATQDTLQQNHKYLYDANGNLIYVNTSTDTKSGVTNKTNERKLMWDEENRLMGIDDNGFVSLYWYDASGERVVKESGYNEGIYVNSTFSGGITDNGNNFTAYVNPYMVVTTGGNYTKHIYIGSQRVVSKLGDLDSYGADPRRIAYAGSECNVTKDYASMYNNSLTQIKTRYATFEVPYNGIDNNDYVNGQGFCCSDNAVKAPALRAMQPNDNPEKLQFYYHSDHLGSTSLITDLDGNVAQHIEYIPFGEVFIEERNATWNTPYKFNAKELDEETGLYYYGARYYDPKLSVWLGVDPMWEKYPSISVYTYCANNPIKLIDPDGRDKKQRDLAIEKSEVYVKQNPGNSYLLGGKGEPGEGIDCSGMVSKCIIAGGEKDPVGRAGATGNGVTQISTGSVKVDIQNAQPGNAIVLDNSSRGDSKPFGHIGIITKVLTDKNNQVIGFKFNDSGGNPENGKSGPRNSTAMIGKDYWGKRVTGIYKWDTKPDVSTPASNTINSAIEQKNFYFEKAPFSIGNWIMDHTPIGTGGHDIGKFLYNSGF